MREINTSGEGTDLVYGWSEEELTSRLGISSAGFQQVRLGGRQIAMIREAGITHLELSTIPRSFDHRDREQVREIVRECEAWPSA